MLSSAGAIAKLLIFIFSELKSYLEHEKKKRHDADLDDVRADPAGYFDKYRMPPPTDKTDLPDDTDTGSGQ